MKILLTGSLAYDHIISFAGHFDEIFTSENLKKLDLGLYGPEKKISFGGCSVNIAYSLSLLKADFILYARGGMDSLVYLDYLKKLKIDTKQIHIDKKEYTATAYIVNDKSNKQMTIFSPGVLLKDFNVDFAKIYKNISIVSISPDDPKFMQKVQEECLKYDLPYLFDPGPQVINLTPQELKKFIKNAYLSIFNENEWNIFSNKTKLTKEYFIKNNKKLIITHSAEGSELLENGKIINIKAVKPAKIVDPTGCGDAYRAGVLYGMSQNWDLKESCELGSKIAAKAIEKRGTQEHKFQNLHSLTSKQSLSCPMLWQNPLTFSL